jgi:hypothetical protein
MREEHGLRVCESRVMEDIWCKRHKVNANWGRLHGEELHHLYSSPNNI